MHDSRRFNNRKETVSLVTLKDILHCRYKTRSIYLEGCIRSYIDPDSVINKIAGAITDNELQVNPNTYTSDQLAHITKQKYFPPASNDHVNTVLQHLAEDHTKVAAQTKHISPPEQTMLYQSRATARRI
jgi:hypothetical protein